MRKRSKAEIDASSVVSKRKPPGEASESEDDEDTINIDFEWFDPQEIDFHGLKNLLRQLFDVDNELFDLSALSNLVLSQPLLGSTVKAPEDGVEIQNTDPFAFLTVLNLHQHRERSEIKTVVDYIVKKTTSIHSLSDLPRLLGTSSEAQVGLILTERFINMPTEIIPPMYNMLLEEISWAVEEKEPYQFTHYLVLSKTYTEIVSKLDSFDEEQSSSSRPHKKSKKDKASSNNVNKASDVGGEVFYFHPEDEVLQKYATGFGTFRYDKQGQEGASDAKRAFQDAGIEPVGHLILIPAEKFHEAVKAVDQHTNPAA